MAGAPVVTRTEMDQRLYGDLESLEEFADQLDQAQQLRPQRISADESNVEQGLARLVLTLIELIRRLLEKQALRRIESGSLTDEQIERMGETFLKLEQKMEELRGAFGLESEDLNLNLGPLGDLMYVCQVPASCGHQRSWAARDEPVKGAPWVCQISTVLLMLCHLPATAELQLPPPLIWPISSSACWTKEL